MRIVRRLKTSRAILRRAYSNTRITTAYQIDVPWCEVAEIAWQLGSTTSQRKLRPRPAAQREEHAKKGPTPALQLLRLVSIRLR